MDEQEYSSWKVRRFVVFDIPHYYPCGGMNDKVASFDTLEEAREFMVQQPSSYDLVIWDLATDDYAD